MGFLNLLTNPIDNALSVFGTILEGECPSRRQVAELINDGISISLIASAFGVSVEVVEGLVNETNTNTS